jgi:hypothetical protein
VAAALEGESSQLAHLLSLITNRLIAILFSKLRMSVKEASKEFCTIMKQVYDPDGLAPSERTRRLRKSMEDVMERKGLPLDLPLTQKTQPGACSG